MGRDEYKMVRGLLGGEGVEEGRTDLRDVGSEEDFLHR